jgi:hypothetical protein
MGLSKLFLLLLLLGSFLMGCHKTKPAGQSVPELDYAQGSTGPAPEIENQLTSNPIVVENLPDPVPSTTDAMPMIQPLPPRATPGRPPKTPAEPRRGVRTPVSVEPVDPHPSVQQPPIKLRPQLSRSDRDTMVRKIGEQLESAKMLVKSLDEAQMPKELQTSLNAVFDFIRKAEDAVKRGEYYQGLVLAQKANTLAATIATTP